MKPFSCAIAAKQAGEDLIGTAGHYRTYVLIECPKPWAANAFSSEQLPLMLRQYVKAQTARRSIQFLCIHRGMGQPPACTPPACTVLIYERADAIALGADAITLGADTLSNRYLGYEFQLDGLEQVLPCLEAHWQSNSLSASTLASTSVQSSEPTSQRPLEKRTQGRTPEQQDILVCTHGMRDKCCAQFGQPFFRAAQQMAKQGHLPNMRIWQVSHIGGHRFAPTAISLPDGRYYGRLTLSVLEAIATRSGPIEQIRSVYRGWGLLPAPLQVLERKLLLKYGWAWLANKIAYQILASAMDGSYFNVALTVQQANGAVSIYRAKLVRDVEQTYCVKSSCSSALPSSFVKYSVAEYSVLKDTQQKKALSLESALSP
jgi:hypothetical protein